MCARYLMCLMCVVFEPLLYTIDSFLSTASIITVTESDMRKGGGEADYNFFYLAYLATAALLV